MSRIMISADPFVPADVFPVPPYNDNVVWPASWLQLPAGQAFAFRNRFDLTAPATVRLHVSADERYELRLDGRPIGRGPERGDARHWFYESYELTLSAGSHVLAARVWALGSNNSPWAQVSVKPGFLLAAEGDLGDTLSTGKGNWEVRVMPGLSFEPASDSFYVTATGQINVFDLSAYPEDWAGDGAWQPALVGDSARSGLGVWHYSNPPYLLPAMLPAMTDTPIKLPTAITPLTVPAGTARELIVDLQDYYCFYPEVTLSGSGRITVGSTEAFHGADGRKLNRNDNSSERNIKEWRRDVFIAGPRAFPVRPVWFRCGRFLILKLEAGNAPLTLEKLELFDCHYPWQFDGRFNTSDQFFAQIDPIMRRTLEMCSHETYVDCPFYEQLMYVGDTRVESLVSNVLSPDRRLQHKAAQLFGWSRDFRGLTASSYPTRGSQTIPGFSLIWIAMLHDNLMWSDAAALVREMMPGVRAVIEAWEHYRRPDGLIESLPGWNYVTLSMIEPTPWKEGVPPGGYPRQVSPVLNMFYLCMTRYAVALERFFGHDDRADWLEARRRQTADALLKLCYVPEYRLFADTAERDFFSEPMQALAIVSGAFPAGTADGLFAPPVKIDPCNFYFSYYYFEACCLAGRYDKMLERFSTWRQIPQWGLSTTPESSSDQSRSDCHAWSTSPVYFWFTALAGIRPASAGFKSVRIAPAPDVLPEISGQLPHPAGMLEFSFNKQEWRVKLPPGIDGVLVDGDREYQLTPGATFVLPRG